MNIPTREECLELLNKYTVPVVIQKHIFLVTKVAVFLAEKLKEKGININVDLVNAASLLHDMLRAVQFNTVVGLTDEEKRACGQLQEKYGNGNHAELGYLALKDKYPEVAEIVRIHSFKNIDKTKTFEQKLVSYADKRSFIEDVRTLKERFQEWEQRHNIQLDENKKEQFYELEKQIFDIVGIEPDKLGEYIE